MLLYARGALERLKSAGYKRGAQAQRALDGRKSGARPATDRRSFQVWSMLARGFYARNLRLFEKHASRVSATRQHGAQASCANGHTSRRANPWCDGAVFGGAIHAGRANVAPKRVVQEWRRAGAKGCLPNRAGFLGGSSFVRVCARGFFARPPLVAGVTLGRLSKYLRPGA